VSFIRLIIRGACFHWREHLGIVAGTAVTTAVLSGALLLGRSVDAVLRHAALARLGKTTVAVDTDRRLFMADLAERLSARLGQPSAVAPLLRLRAVAATVAGEADAAGGPAQAGRVQAIGIDERFWRLAFAAGATPADDKVLLNARLAGDLGVQVGDAIALRIEVPSPLPSDAPLAGRRDEGYRRATLTVAGILGDDQLGRFGLAASQTAPRNAFVHLPVLQELCGCPGQANTLLVATSDGMDAVGSVAKALRDAWRLADAGLRLRGHPGTTRASLESTRIFLPADVNEATVAEALPAGQDAPGVPQAVAGSLSYLVNTIRRGGAADAPATPYSFVTALRPAPDGLSGPVPADLDDDEIVINAWLADQLAAGVGDTVTLDYSVPGVGEGFVEASRDFRVRAVVPMSALDGEREAMPRFPGLSDVESCTGWDIGMPLDKARLSDPANEAYWREFGETPKAFVTLPAGQQMWGNRFGNLMAIRLPAPAGSGAEVENRLTRALDPAQLGLTAMPVRETALRAVSQAMDFGALFLGMSLFLVAASLILTCLFFVFAFERRAAELGTLLAVGYRRGQIQGLVVAEAVVPALLGVLAGGLAGPLYAAGLLRAVGAHWAGALANSAIPFRLSWAALAGGAATAFLCSLAAMALTLRQLLRRRVRELLAQLAAQVDDAPWPSAEATASRRGQPRRLAAKMAAAFLVAAAGVTVAGTLGGRANPAPVFFAAGFLLLCAGLVAAWHLLHSADGARDRPARLSLARLGIRGAGRRPGRALTVVGVLACGFFLVVAVAAMRHDPAYGAERRESGTGGFSLWVELSLPLLEPLETAPGRTRYRLDGTPAAEATFVSLKTRDGDDASCLNLNRAQAPRLIGVDPAVMSARNAMLGPRERGLWERLERDGGENCVPALAGDTTTAAWGLRKRVGPDNGDTLSYVDESGRPFTVRLVGALPPSISIFQGTLLISQRHFAARFPSEGGYRTVLVETTASRQDGVAAVLRQRLSRHGPEVTGCVGRLREFAAVEHAYLMLFLALGGLGLLLGTAGLAVVVWRNLSERRRELAVLRATGFSRRQIRRLVLVEHLWLFGLGVVVGAAAALLALVPTAARPLADLPLAEAGIVLGGLVVFATAWIWLGVRLATRGPLVSALRNE